MDFAPLTDEKKLKVIEHYREQLRLANEMARLDALPKDKRANELRDALVSIAGGSDDWQQTLKNDPAYAAWADRINSQNEDR